MGFWGVLPFANDDAADWAIALDEASAAGRVELVGRVLERFVDDGEEAGHWDVPRVVAAAALVAAQCPGGEAVRSVHGPQEPMPQFPAGLRGLAADALDAVLVSEDWRPALWVDAQAGLAWRRGLVALRDVLSPPQAETLF